MVQPAGNGGNALKKSPTGSWAIWLSDANASVVTADIPPCTAMSGENRRAKSEPSATSA